MDTNVIDATVIEPDPAGLNVRLPGEPDDGNGLVPGSAGERPFGVAARLWSGVRRELSRFAALSPGRRNAPGVGGPAPGEPDDGNGLVPGSAGERPSGVAGRPRSGVRRVLSPFATLSAGRRNALLTSALVLTAAAGLALLLTHGSPPRVAVKANGVAVPPGVKQPLAPAASLANVPLPASGPVVRPAYKPVPKDQQVEELLSLQPGQAGAPKPAAGAAEAGPRQTAAAAPGQPSQASHGAEKPPPGYVPSEPGSAAAETFQAASAAAPADTAAASATPAHTDGSREPPPAAAPAQSLVGSVFAAFHTAEPPVVSHGDVVKAAHDLQAAPMTPPEQVQVLGLVTEMAALVHDLREQDAQLRGDLQKTTADTTARLGDFERRIALAEARSAVSAARDAGAASPTPMPGAAPAKPVVLTRAEAALPLPDTGPAKRYRVQAASPGLALLAEVDRGGGDGAQIQVNVGESVPGYGKVTAIGQKGTGWVVTTEHGVIQ